MMDDMEAPSFCLGFDFDDSETQTPLHSSDHPQHPKLNRLPRCTSSLDALFTGDEHLQIQHTAVCTSSNKIENRNQNVGEPVSISCSSLVFSKFTVTPLKRFQLIDSDHPYVSDSDKCNLPVKRRQPKVDESSNLLETPAMDEFCEEYVGPIKYESNAIEQSNQSNHVITSSVNVDDSYLPAYRYYFHDDPRIQELVRSRLPNFFPLGNSLNKDLDQPSASNIDYMRQFNCGESTKQSATNTNDKQSSSGRKSSRKLKAEETSQGWVNPKLCVNKATTKRGPKRKGHAARQTSGRWLTESDGKKVITLSKLAWRHEFTSPEEVYVGKTGQELSGRVAYMRYKQESGGEFIKGKRKSATKKKKK